MISSNNSNTMSERIPHLQRHNDNVHESHHQLNIQRHNDDVHESHLHYCNQSKLNRQMIYSKLWTDLGSHPNERFESQLVVPKLPTDQLMRELRNELTEMKTLESTTLQTVGGLRRTKNSKDIS